MPRNRKSAGQVIMGEILKYAFALVVAVAVGVIFFYVATNLFAEAVQQTLRP